MSGDHNQYQKTKSYLNDDFECPRCGHCCHVEEERMSTQPKALRLADALDAEFVQGRISNSTGRESAVELRRLYDLVCVCGAVWEGEMMVHPPRKREWVGLTDGERSYYLQSASNVGWWQAAKMIEAKLKEKNQ